MEGYGRENVVGVRYGGYGRRVYGREGYVWEGYGRVD